MFSSFTLFRSFVNPGDLVVCHEIKGFPGSKMAARVLSRPSREGFAWVRETRGLKARPENWVPFVIEWPIEKMA